VLKDKLEAKAIITGASGFVGSRLRDALLDAGADVIAIRRASSPEPKRGRSVVADYDDRSGLEKLMRDEKPDFVFHVAGATKGVTYDDFQRANVMPTQHLFEALAEAHPEVGRFLLVSSLAAYGPSTPDQPLDASSARRPIEHYGRSKAEAEELLEGANGGSPAWTVIRPAGVYGPGDGDYFNLFREASKGRNVFFGNRKRWFSAVYVDDCVRAIVAGATSDREERHRQRAWLLHLRRQADHLGAFPGRDRPRQRPPRAHPESSRDAGRRGCHRWRARHPRRWQATPVQPPEGEDGRARGVDLQPRRRAQGLRLRAGDRRARRREARLRLVPRERLAVAAVPRRQSVRALATMLTLS
jgi:nucleoside-diphosphate-sugar epimerase